MMTFWQKITRRLLHSHEERVQAQVDEIGELQESARQRRAELASEQDQAENSGKASSPTALADSRQRVTEAEAAYARAMQSWDDKQFRQ